MPTTPRWALPYPPSTDPPNGPAEFQALALALDGVAFDDQGTLANRPVSSSGTPGKKGRYYLVAGDGTPANNGILWRDNGTGWDAIGALFDGSVTQAKLAAGAAAGQSYGTAFPTSGLYNGYRFTLFFNGIQGDFIYRADLDGTYPWHAVACPPIVLSRSSVGTSSVTFTRAGVYRGLFAGGASVSSGGDAGVSSSFGGSGIGTANAAAGGGAGEFTSSAGGTASVTISGTTSPGGNVGALFFPVKLI